MSKRYDPIAATVIAVSDRAVLVDTGDSSTWIPKSLIDESDLDNLRPGMTTEINVQSWFLEKEGLL